MGYRDMVSVDYSITLDTSNLEERLSTIESKLEAVEPVDEATVQNMIDEKVNDHTHDDVDKDAVEEIVRDLMHSEGEDFVEGVVNNMALISESDVDDKIREAGFVESDDLDSRIENYLGDNDYVTSDEVDTAITDKLEELGLEADKVADAEEVETLKADLADLTRRFELYANRADLYISLTERLTQTEALLGRVQDVTTGHDHRLVTHGDYILKLDERINALEGQTPDDLRVLTERMKVLEDNNTVAMQFFGLIQRAFELLRAGR